MRCALIVQTRSPFPTMFGAVDATACLRMAFHGLGGAAAGYDQKPVQCPAELPLRSPSPSPSGR